jgi:hypothetical protein
MGSAIESGHLLSLGICLIQKRLERKRMPHPAKLFLFLALTAGIGSGTPHFGTWKMNPERSQFDPGPPRLKSFTLQFAPAENGTTRVTADGETGDGTPFHTSYVLRQDGKDYPVTNAPFDSVSVTEIDSNTQMVISKRSGRVIEKTRVVFAGKTMTETSEGTDPSGHAYHGVVVLEKQ